MASITADPTTSRCLLVVAKPAGAPELRRLHDRNPGRALQLRVLAPAFVRSRLQFLASDVDAGIEAARSRLDRSLAELDADGRFLADGEVGETDALAAIDTALVGFDADEIVIVPSDGHGHWHENRLLEDARERFGVPVRELAAA